LSEGVPKQATAVMLISSSLVFVKSKGRKKTRTGFTNLRKRRTNRDPNGQMRRTEKKVGVRWGSEAIEARTAGFSRKSDPSIRSNWT
jgi:hypothetical protein